MMRHVSALIAPCVLITSLLLVGCASQEHTDNTKGIRGAGDSITMYQQYNALFEQAIAKLSLPGYTREEDTQSNKWNTFVDKAVSFGKRSVMTIDGTQNGSSTQNRIVYTANDGTNAVYVDFIYLPTEIGDDIIYSDFPSVKYQNAPVMNQSDEAILSYHNTLVKVTVYALSKQTVEKMKAAQYQADVALVHFLKGTT